MKEGWRHLEQGDLLVYHGSNVTHLIRQLSRDDPEYPELLGHIPDPPAMLFYRGDLRLLTTPCIGVVGTRKLTPYGKQAATAVTRDLVRHGFTIVSGLALGADTAAHNAALEHGGNTIAILGTGVDDGTIFPQSNVTLARTILDKGGLIMSEYAAGTHGAKFTFPRRNRIISGLSKGVVVIEADEKSGALITARCALEQNRDVFAVPGPIFSPRSIGPNRLIQSGAKLVLSAADIIQEYQELPLFAHNRSRQQGTPLEEKIISIIEIHGQPFIDTIIAESGNQAHHVISALSMLELRGAIKSTPGGKYFLNI